jgi:hypothetical protein
MHTMTPLSNDAALSTDTTLSPNALHYNSYRGRRDSTPSVNSMDGFGDDYEDGEDCDGFGSHDVSRSTSEYGFDENSSY